MAKFLIHIDGEDVEIDGVQEALDERFDQDVTVEPYVEPVLESTITDEPESIE